MEALLFIVFIIALCVALAHEWCVDCRSWKTFNWNDKTRDMSHKRISRSNHNQYCFRCRRMTAEDAFGRVVGLRARIAEWHSGLDLRHKGLDDY